MTLKRGTSFTGINVQPTVRAKGSIIASDVDTIAADQGYVMEKLTNLDAADGTTSPPPTNTGHHQGESGNLLYRTLFSQAFGAGSFTRWTGEGTYDNYAESYSILSHASSTEEYDVILFTPIIFVPRGFENKDIVVVINVQGTSVGDPRIRMTVKDSSLVAVSGYGNVQFEWGWVNQNAAEMLDDMGEISRDYWAASFQVSTAGLYVLEIKTDVNNEYEYRFFRDVIVRAKVSPSNRLPIPLRAPDVAAANSVQVGDPDSSNAWHPIDSALTAVDGPLDAVLLLLAHNFARLFELATGLPAPGQATATLTGHDHDGSNSAEVEHVCASWCYGTNSSNAAISGRGKAARAIVTAPLTIIDVVRLQIPTTINTAAGTSKLKVAVLHYSVPSKGDRGKVVVTNSTAGGGGANFTATAEGFQLQTVPTSGDTTQPVTSGALNTFVAEFIANALGGTGPGPQVMAICLYFDQ